MQIVYVQGLHDDRQDNHDTVLNTIHCFIFHQFTAAVRPADIVEDCGYY